MGTDRTGKLIIRPRAVARNEYMQFNSCMSLATSGRHGAHAASKFNFLGRFDRLVSGGLPKGKPVPAVVIAIVSILQITGLLKFAEVVVVDPESV